MKKFIFTILLTIYGGILIKIMVFKNMPTVRIGHLMLNFSGTDANGEANLIPFRTILSYLLGYKGWIIDGINLAGNILPLIPIGLIIPFVFNNLTWKKTVILAFVSGLTIETLQVVLKVGILDVDDIILNGLGVMIGYGVFALLTKALVKPQS